MSRIAFGVKDLWEELRHCSPVLMYGTGNGADKILEQMSRRGIVCDGFFVSDGFVRDRYFHGLRVMSLDEAEKKFGDFTALMAFGSARTEVIENVKNIMSRHDFFAPDVPVASGEVFDSDFYFSHEKEIDEARSLLADGLSVKTFDDVIRYKISGDVRYLFDCETPESDADALLCGDYTAYVDLGAYTGDTMKKTLGLYPTIRKAVAFEPAKKPFEKLSALCREYDVEFSLFNMCASDVTETRLLSDGGGRGSRLSAEKSSSGAKTRAVQCSPLDDAAKLYGERLLIKIDVEGEERRAINGALQTIKNSDTDMLVSLYHRSEDLFSLPIMIHGICPQRRLYIRKLPGLPAWDINLYVCI